MVQGHAAGESPPVRVKCVMAAVRRKRLPFFPVRTIYSLDREMATESLELLPGTLYMLILRTLIRGPMHGYAIARRIKESSSDALTIEEGSLYPALNRMLVKGW